MCLIHREFRTFEISRIFIKHVRIASLGWEISHVSGFSSIVIGCWSTQFQYISLFAFENSHYLCTGTGAKAEKAHNRLRSLCRLVLAAGALLALDGTLALRCVFRRLLHTLTTHTSSRTTSCATGGVQQITGKTRAAPNPRSGGRSRRLKWVCVRGIRPHVWCVLVGTIPVARRLRKAVLRDDVSPRWHKHGVYFVEKPGTGVSFARPDCTEIGYSFVWAKPDLDRTESLIGPTPSTIRN